MKVLFVTTNPAKVNKYKDLLQEKGIELITISILWTNHVKKEIQAIHYMLNDKSNY